MRRTCGEKGKEMLKLEEKRGRGRLGRYSASQEGKSLAPRKKFTLLTHTTPKMDSGKKSLSRITERVQGNNESVKNLTI